MIRIPAPCKSKYHAKKTVIDNITFDSHLEALRYIELKRLKQAGIVKTIEVQPVFSLQPRFWKCCGAVWGSLELKKKDKCPICGKKVPATQQITYVADFRVTYADGHQEIEDVKGMETALFKLKRKMFEYRYPELTLRIVKGVHR
jgi:predicted Zn-ribbon and HTH transcriptional regulator